MPRGQRAIRGLGGRGGDRGRGGQGGRYSNRAMASSLSDSSSDDDDDVHARSLKAPKQIPQELFNDEGSYPGIKLIVDGETFLPTNASWQSKAISLQPCFSQGCANLHNEMLSLGMLGEKLST
mmetsp:Transcript_16559/g.21671  ORF Transcript_16559/g.21671 Transcript_16559/m.21671 type:complete len:123 (-) Transcript_16559:357-725(-)